MPILAHAKKALRASKKKTEFNKQVKSRTKTALDAMVKQPTVERLAAVYQAVDKATKRKVFHANKAARLKSQMAALLK